MGVDDIAANVIGVATSAEEASKKARKTKDAANLLEGISKRLANMVVRFGTNGAHSASAHIPAQASVLEIPAGGAEGKNTENMLLNTNDEYYGPAMEPVFPDDNGSVNTKAIS